MLAKLAHKVRKLQDCDYEWPFGITLNCGPVYTEIKPG